MEKFTKVTGVAVPLPMQDVDTDQIIPAQYLTSVSKAGYGANLFRRLRDNDPNFPLTQPRYKGAPILVADRNFGCGSSREHAVWALKDAGFRVIIGKSFADIFASNSAKNGLLLVVLPEKEIDDLFEAAQKGTISIAVDLDTQRVVLPDGRAIEFPYDSFRRHCLLHGLDDIDYILSHRERIEAFRKDQEKFRFANTLSPS